MSQEPAVLRECREGICRLTLSAPWRGNALDPGMLSRLEALLLNLPADARVVVLEGAGGRSFCTGYHLPTLAAEVEAGPSVTDFENHPLERALRALEGCPLPTLAVVGGHAFGGGCELALACDLRLAAREARLCMPPARLGILYSATGLARLLALVGPAVAKELIYTGEPVEAERALALGLVNRVVPRDELAEAAAGLAAQIAANEPLSLRHHKTLFDRYLAPPPLSEAALREVARLRQECFASPGFRERMSRALA